MLKLTLQPGEFITIGDDIKVIFSGGSANNIHILVDAPRELNIDRSNTRANRANNPSPYYKEKAISEKAQKEIAAIIKRDKEQRL